MKNSRRTFFKQGLAGALALGSASLSIPAAAMTDAYLRADMEVANLMHVVRNLH